MLSVRFPGVRPTPLTTMSHFGSYRQLWGRPTESGFGDLPEKKRKGASGRPPTKGGRREEDLRPPARISEGTSIAFQLDHLRNTILRLRPGDAHAPLEALLRTTDSGTKALEAILADARSLTKKAKEARIRQIQQWSGVSGADISALAALLNQAREENRAAEKQQATEQAAAVQAAIDRETPLLLIAANAVEGLLIGNDIWVIWDSIHLSPALALAELKEERQNRSYYWHEYLRDPLEQLTTRVFQLKQAGLSDIQYRSLRAQVDAALNTDDKKADRQQRIQRISPYRRPKTTDIQDVASNIPAIVLAWMDDAWRNANQPPARTRGRSPGLDIRHWTG